MFEQGLAYLLKKFIGSFVEDSDAIKEKVQVGAWSGLIVLENLRIKSSLLAMVDIPIALSYGYIGRFELRIPWGNLGVDPVMVIIDKVYVVIEPKYQWNPGAADRREQAVKQAKLAAAELFANKRLAPAAAGQSYGDIAKSWLMTSFINKIIDNIQVTVREVHVRYEDQLSCQSNFCVGVTLESLHVQSRDSTFSFDANYSPKKDVPRSAFASGTDVEPELKTQGYETFHKLIQVNHLSIYWNPLVPSGLNACSCIFRGRPAADILNLMYRTIPTRAHQITDRPRHHFILLPVDINHYLDVSFNTSTGMVKANAKLVITDLAICLEDLQLREIISVAINMGSFAKLQRFSEFRPSKGIFEDPAAWWRYAINAVLLQIRIDRKKHLNLRDISQRYRDKLVYTELWKSKLVSPASVLNQLARVDDSVKPVLDREGSAVYNALYQRAKRAADALAVKQDQDGTLKAPTHTHKGAKHLKVVATLNNAAIASEEHRNANRPITAGVSINKTSAAGPAATQTTPVQPLNKDTIELLQKLEYYLEFEDIVLFRSLAEKNLSVETTTQSWIGGWLSWMGSGGPSNTVSEEEKRKLFEALKYDPDRLLRGGVKEVNQNEVMAIVSVQVHQMSVTLALTSPDMNSAFQTSIPFLKLELEDMRNRSVIMGDGAHVSVSLSLQDFSAYEVVPTTSALSALRKDTAKQKNKILFRRELRGPSHSQGDWGQSSVNSKYLEASADRSSIGRSGLRHRSEELRPLFSTLIEILPPNKDTDVIVRLTVEELEVWVNPVAKWTNAMMTFVAWPSDQQYWSEMEMGAMNQLADFKARFDAKIKYMMDNHQNIVIEAHVQAPVVVVSDQASHLESGTGDVLVIDLGTITLSTEKLAKAQRQRLLDARSQTGFTSDATNTTPRGRSASAAERLRASTSKVATVLDFSERKLPPVPEPPGWEVLADDADGEESPPIQGKVLYSDNSTVDTPLIKSTNTSAVEDNSGLRRSDLESVDSGVASSEIKSEDDRSGGYMAGAYGAQSAPSIASSLHTAGMEFEHDDGSLFDVFQCQVSQIEVYLISSAVINDPAAMDCDVSKTVIVDKFEVGLEIHVSVLPWDITIPPVKLVSDIPEINIKLSEQKLIRLKQFSTELITDDSQAMLASNLARINKLNNMLKRKSTDMGGGASKSSSRVVSSRLSLMSNASSMLNIRSKSRRTMSLGEVSSVNDLAFYDTVTGRNSMRTNPMRDSSAVGGAVASSRKSALRGEGQRSRSRAGSTSFKDVLENESIPAELRLKRLVATSYVVGSDDGQGEDGGAATAAESRILPAAAAAAAVIEAAGAESGLVEDGGDDDDDSFFSVEEHVNAEEHARQKEHLQFVISQREAMRAKLMSDIRTSEADASKAALHETLKRELVLCEQELQQLRVAFVELLMSTEDLDLYDADQDAQAVKKFHDGMLLPVYNIDTGEKMHNGPGPKRDLAQASVFKVPPTRAKQLHNETSNRELVYMRTNITVVNVDLECTSDDKLVNTILGTGKEKAKKSQKSARKSEFAKEFSAALPVVVCRLRLCGISSKLRHRSQDSRVGFALQELDVEDFVQAPLLGGGSGGGEPAKLSLRGRSSTIVLVSSDPANFGLCTLPTANRYNSRGGSDLVKVKYEVVYGADRLDENGEERVDGDAQDTHNVKVSMGTVGVNIEQTRIALLMLTVHRVLQNAGLLSPAATPLPVPEKDNSNTTEAASPALQSKPSETVGAAPVVPSGRGFLPNVILWAKIDCVNVSLLTSKAEPLLTVQLWALSTSVQSRYQSATISLRLADVAVHCNHPMQRLRGDSDLYSRGSRRDSEESVTVEKISLFGRDPNSMLPFISTSLHYEKDSEDSMSPPLVIASVKTVPVIVCADLDCFHSIIREVVDGPIMEAAAVFTALGPPAAPVKMALDIPSAPQKAPLVVGATLDQLLNPLVDMCNGRVEIVMGAVTLICAESSTVASSAYQPTAAVPNELRTTLRTVEANLMWGDICEFGAVQGTVGIQGIQLTCCGHAVNDPIDVFCKVAAMPNGYFVPPNQSDTVANLTFNTSFPPPEQSEIERNMCQVAVGVAPIVLHVNEGLLRAGLAWVQYIVPAAQRIQTALAPLEAMADPMLVPLLPVPPTSLEASQAAAVRTTPAPLVDLDCKVVACVLLYEVVVSMEVGTAATAATSQPKADASAASTRSDHKSRPLSASKSKHSRKHKHMGPAEGSGHIATESYMPVFRLVARSIGGEVSLRPAHVDDKQHNDTHRGDHCETAVQSASVWVLSASCGVDAVHLEHIKFSGTTYKRLLSTGLTAEQSTTPPLGLSRSETAGSGGSLGALEADLFGPVTVEDEAEHQVFRFLTMDATLLQDNSLSAAVKVDNVHVTFIAEAALAAIALGDVYVAALVPQAPKASPRRVESRGNLRSTSPMPNRRGDGGSAYNSFHYAHPSSVPMAPASSAATEVAATPPTPLPLTLLTANSFALGGALRSMSLNASITQCFVYVPSERHNGTGPSVCVSVEVDSEVCILPVSSEKWRGVLSVLGDSDHAYSPSGEEKSRDSQDASATAAGVQPLLTARCVLNSAEVYLVKALPSDICNPVPPLDVVAQGAAADPGSPVRIRTARFPVSPKRDSPMPQRPETPMSTHTSNTSLAASVGKEGAVNYHGKSLLFPVGAEILYTLSMEMVGPEPHIADRSRRGDSVCSTELDCLRVAEGTTLRLSQRLQVDVQTDVDIQGYLDVRPLVRVFETSIKPIIDAVDAQSTAQSKGRAASATARREPSPSPEKRARSVDLRDAKKAESQARASPTTAALVQLREGMSLLQVGSIFELLGAVVDLSVLQATVHIPNVIVYVINDVFSPALSVARVCCRDISVSATIARPFRDNKVLVLRDALRCTTPAEDDHNGAPTAESAPELNNSLMRRVRLFAEARILSPARALSNKLMPTATVVGATAGKRHSDPPEAERPTGPWVSLSAKATIAVEYYNQRFTAREQLVESFPLHVQLTVPYAEGTANHPVYTLVNLRASTSGDGGAVSRDDAMFAEYLTKHIHPTTEGESASTPLTPTEVPVVLSSPMSVHVQLPEPVVVNASMTLAEIALMTAQSVQAVTSTLGTAGSTGGSSGHRHHQNIEMSLFSIRNDSGLPLRYWTDDATSAHDVAPNTEAPLLLQRRAEDAQRSSFPVCGWQSVVRYLNLAVQDVGDHTWQELRDVPLDGEGTRLFDVRFRKHGGDHERGSGGHRSANVVSTTLALELVTRGCKKTLIVRSTMRIYNSTKAAFRVQLVSGFRTMRRDVLWEAVVPPNQGIPVPAHLSNVRNGRFLVLPLLHLSPSGFKGSYWPELSAPQSAADALGAEVPMPSLPSHAREVREHAHSSPGSPVDHSADSEGGTRLPSNYRHWRLNLVAQRGKASMQAYAHWLTFGAGAAAVEPSLTPHLPQLPPTTDLLSALSQAAHVAYCNVSVVSKGHSLRGSAAGGSGDAESAMLRTLTFVAPVTVVNLTAGAIDVALTPDLGGTADANNLEPLLKQDRHLNARLPQASLLPGDSWDYLAVHSTSSVCLSLKLGANGGSGTTASACDEWSEALVIPGCGASTSGTATYAVDVPYANGSRLSVQVEVTDNNGARVVSVYVPYWVVTDSFLPLQYQHDERYAGARDKHVNGADGLAADQTFAVLAHSQLSSEDRSVKTSALTPAKTILPHSGLGRARGLDGVILGPELPTRGLVDILAPSAGQPKIMSKYTYRKPVVAEDRRVRAPDVQPQQAALGGFPRSPSPGLELAIADTATAATVLTEAPAARSRPYHVVQCSYTNSDTRTARLRLRTGTTSQWSPCFSLDSTSITSVEVASAPRDPTSEDADIVRALPHMANARGGGGTRTFSLAAQAVRAEPPFHRTHMVVLVDKYTLVNAVGHPIEVRQVGQESVFSLRTEDEVPLWWTAGASTQHLQVRLARYGWSWSGRFPVSAEGDFSIRLRNDFDNTVFFVLVRVLSKGPHVYVVFKGGEKFSPYRFENHTLNTFRIRQQGQTPCTVLLPYHSSAYAWDEPLSTQNVEVEVLRNALRAQDDWGAVGVFNFTAVGTLELPRGADESCAQHLLVRVVAEGSTRVLQLFDLRTFQTEEFPPVQLADGHRNGWGALSMFYRPDSRLYHRCTPMLVQITAEIAHVGLSVVDHSPQELVNVTLSGIHVEHSIYSKEEVTHLDLQRLQVDNQLLSALNPCMVYPVSGDDKYLSLVLHRSTQYAGVEFIPLLKVAVAPFRVEVDRDMIEHTQDAVVHLIDMISASGITSTGSDALSLLPVIESPVSQPVRGPFSPQSLRNGTTAGNAMVVSHLASAVHSADQDQGAPPATPVSYQDGLDMVASSPFALGDRLRASQVNRVHSMLRSVPQTAQLDRPPSRSDGPQRTQASGAYSAPLNGQKPKRSALKRTAVTPGGLSLQPPSGPGRSVPSALTVPARKPAALAKPRFNHKNTISHLLVRGLLNKLATPSAVPDPAPAAFVRRLEVSGLNLYASLDTRMASTDRDAAAHGDVWSFLKGLGWMMGSLVALEDFSIRLGPTALENVSMSGADVGVKLAQIHALRAFLHVPALLLSMGVVGNLWSSVNVLADGVRDFIALPLEGLGESPTAFMKGVALGTKSLVCASASTVVDTAATFVATMERTLALYPGVRVCESSAAADDSEMSTAVVPVASAKADSTAVVCTEETGKPDKAEAACRTSDAAPIVVQRPKRTLHGVALGITGLIVDPAAGFSADGVRGFALGLLTGSVGVVLRPAYGALVDASFLLRTTSWYLQSLSGRLRQPMQRVRAPRSFLRREPSLRLYSSDRNMGEDLLARLHRGEFSREGYLSHSVLRDHTVLLVTNARVLVVSHSFGAEEVLWNCPISEMRAVEVEHHQPAAVSDVRGDHADFAANARRLQARGLNMELTRDTAAPDSEVGTLQATAANPAAQELSAERIQDGQPVVHIYHEHHGAESVAADTDVVEGGTSRLAHKILLCTSHAQARDLLVLLLERNSALSCSAVLSYLQGSNVNVGDVLKHRRTPSPVQL